MELTETPAKEWFCLSNVVEEEGELGYPHLGNPQERGSCRRKPPMIPDRQSGMTLGCFTRVW